MGTIVARQRKNGTTGYTAQIQLKRKGVIVHREAKTFDRKQAAQAWLKRRETELAEPGALDRKDDPTLEHAIDRYIAELKRPMGHTKAQVLRSIKRDPVASLACSKVDSAALLAFAQRIQAKPQTVAHYLSTLGAVFAVARPAWGYPLDAQTMRDAITVGRKMGVLGRSKMRDRLPTMDEIDRLMRHFGRIRSHRVDSIPMQAIFAFALYSSRRQEEICRIRWEDLDEEHSRIWVRDMKNPEGAEGNDVLVDLPPEALAIIKAQPRRGERIFPHNPDTVSAAFTRACQFLDIKDLHFHDARHSAVSRLFEMGWNIPHVAAVSGHRSWVALKRYTHIKQKTDRMKDWPWLEVVTKKTPPKRGQRVAAD